MTQLGVQANVTHSHRSVQDGSAEICCTVNKPKPCTTPGEGLGSYLHTRRSMQKHAHKRAQPRALMNTGYGQNERNANDGRKALTGVRESG